MAITLLLRFLFGGLAVAAFSLIGDLVRPRTLAGIFGAAPAVALGSLALCYETLGPAGVHTQTSFLTIGAAAMFVYAWFAAWIVRLDKLPTWMGAALSWIVWAIVAFGIFFVVQTVGGAS